MRPTERCRPTARATCEFTESDVRGVCRPQVIGGVICANRVSLFTGWRCQARQRDELPLRIRLREATDYKFAVECTEG